MQAVLMAGGKGTRLRPFTNILPKPLVPIGEMSILELVLRQLKSCGFEEIVIAVGHKADLIMAVIGDGSRMGLKIRYHMEEQPLGTLGALATIEDLDENFLVMNGDICTNLDFSQLYQAHVDSGEMVSVSTFPRRERIELGVLQLNDDMDRVCGFEEKPVHNFYVSMGVNAFHRTVLDIIPQKVFFGFDHLMESLLEQSIAIHAYRFHGVWHDIGRPDDYQRVLDEFEKTPSIYLPEEETELQTLPFRRAA